MEPLSLLITLFSAINMARELGKSSRPHGDG